MRKKLVVALASLAALFSLAVPAGAQAAPAATEGAVAVQTVPASSQLEQYGPFHYWVYLGKGICQLDKTGSNLWRIGDVGQSAESGTATVTMGYRTTNCSDFGDYQTIKYYLYSAPDGQCAKITKSETAFGYQVNYSTHYVTAGSIWLNTYYDQCYDTETERMHIVGQMTGTLLGISKYLDAANNDALMNGSFWTARGFWANDRNNLWYKYSNR